MKRKANPETKDLKRVKTSDTSLPSERLLRVISEEVNKVHPVDFQKVNRTVNLFSEGLSLHFVARYRKDVHGYLHESVLANIEKVYHEITEVNRRSEIVATKLEAKFSRDERPEIFEALKNARHLQDVEEIYSPFKSARKSKAETARDLGFLSTSEEIMSVFSWNRYSFLKDKECPVEKLEDVCSNLDMCKYIISEHVWNTSALNQKFRESVFSHNRSCTFRSKMKVEDDNFTVYSDFQKPINCLREHAFHAVKRGVSQKKLVQTYEFSNVYLEHVLSDIKHFLTKFDPKSYRSKEYGRDLKNFRAWHDFFHSVAKYTLQNFVKPSLTRYVHRVLSQKFEAEAVDVFSRNLEFLLLTPPLRIFFPSECHVLGVDPGFRHGNKMTLVDPKTNRILKSGKLFIDKNSGHNLTEFLRDINLPLIVALGNGTGSSDFSKFLDSFQTDIDIYVTVVDESGSSVYSTSPLAQDELPDLDPQLRSAVSIARRLIDPLSEFLKIDPTAIGVGSYQKDLKLGKPLMEKIVDCVHKVGVDLNTASARLLEKVSGLTKSTAQKIVVEREKSAFLSRADFSKRVKLSKSAFEQAIGFLKVFTNPLDSSFVHPENYKIAEAILKKGGFEAIENLDLEKAKSWTLQEILDFLQVPSSLKVEKLGLLDILDDLKRYNVDYREGMETPSLTKPGTRSEDGTILGHVRNIVTYGAFIDIGGESCLLHKNQLHSDLATLRIGQKIGVRVRHNEDSKRKSLEEV